MNTWHKRLQEALTVRGKEWGDLFSHLHHLTGIKKPSVYAWKPDAEKRSTMMNGDNAAVVCEWLHINPMWLFFGTGASGLSTDSTEQALLDAYRKLPKDDQDRVLFNVTADAAFHEYKSKQKPEIVKNLA